MKYDSNNCDFIVLKAVQAKRDTTLLFQYHICSPFDHNIYMLIQIMTKLIDVFCGECVRPSIECHIPEKK